MVVTCSKCRYDLTGTPRSGRCPECGQAAEISYELAELAAVRKPVHPLGWAAVFVCSAGALSIAGLFVSFEIDTWTFDLFFFGLLLWYMLPFIALGWTAYVVRRHALPAIGAFVASVGLAAIMASGYILMMNVGPFDAAMILILFPILPWAATAIAMVVLALSTRR